MLLEVGLDKRPPHWDISAGSSLPSVGTERTRRYSGREARILLPLGLLMAGGVAAFRRVSDQEAMVSVTRWDYGLKRTPPYVPRWIRPDTVHAGKASGAIPSNALAFEAGNDGQPFASLEDWIDACNRLDVAGAIETPVTAKTLRRCYIYRGLYGAGKENVRLRWTGREEGTRHCWLHTYIDDVVIRGINFDGFNCAVGTTFPALPLRESAEGKIDPEPYHTSTESVYKSLNASEDGAAFGFHTRRLGRIMPLGQFSIDAISVRRQIARTTAKANRQNASYFEDLVWQSVLETVSLFSGVRCSTVQAVVAAINAQSDRTGYKAQFRKDKVFILAVDHRSQAFVEIELEGNGTFESDVQTPAVDISHCTFTDTDLGYGAILDVSQLGPVVFCRNDLAGTWGGVGALVTRWSDIYFANNHWHDCSSKRPPARGRASSQLPAGSSLSAYNTACLIGTNSPVMMRYHRTGNTALIENNKVDNVESLNANDTVNCAVLADVRNGWQVTSASKIIRFAYNHVSHLIGLAGAQDCNIIYGKLRGFSVIANYFENFGAGYVNAGTNSEGSEAACLLFKNPGPYNMPIDGRPAEPAIISGNIFIDGPVGTPWVKVDELASDLTVADNLFRNWKNKKGGLAVTAGPKAGLLRFTNHQQGVRIQGNSFENIAVDQYPRFFLINFWNLSPFARSFDFRRFEFSGNTLLNDGTDQYPVPQTSVAVLNFQFNSGNPQDPRNAFAQIATGHNVILSKPGRPSSNVLQMFHDNGKAVYQGTQHASEARLAPADYLRFYGSAR